MPAWTPTPVWRGSDVFIIGGGPSLQSFDWRKLRGKHTIGCNAAFRLGKDTCRLCFFSDGHWFYRMEQELSFFEGRLVTHSPEISSDHPWISVVARKEIGLHKDAVGFGGNSGCSAINLALLMGAQRVFLLGFDMRLGSSGRMNWHNVSVEPSNPDVFPKFQEGFEAIARDLPTVFPGCSIVNLTDSSELSVFPKQPINSIL